MQNLQQYEALKKKNLIEYILCETLITANTLNFNVKTKNKLNGNLKEFCPL